MVQKGLHHVLLKSKAKERVGGGKRKKGKEWQGKNERTVVCAFRPEVGARSFQPPTTKPAKKKTYWGRGRSGDETAGVGGKESLLDRGIAGPTNQQSGPKKPRTKSNSSRNDE